MIIEQRRVRNVDRHLGFIADGWTVVIALTELSRHSVRLGRAGLAESPEIGTALLPAVVGPISRFNAEGRWQIHRNQPKETVYRQVEWTRQEWRGRDRREEIRDIRDVPYERYPRTRIPPPSIELTALLQATDAPALVTPAIEYRDGNKEAIRHRLNLLLELFGECSVLTDDLEPLMNPPTRRLNWKVLPAGTRSIDELKRELRPVLDEMGSRTRPVAEHRLRTMESHEPDFTAVGQGGFRGYIVFGFGRRGLHVLESLRWGNATYVLGSDWEQISRRSKAEILDEGLHEDRLVHTSGWENRVARLLRR